MTLLYFDRQENEIKKTCKRKKKKKGTDGPCVKRKTNFEDEDAIYYIKRRRELRDSRPNRVVNHIYYPEL